MNKIITLIIIVALASCTGEKTAEQLNAEITSTRGKIAELTRHLEELEGQLAGMESEVLDKGIPVVVEALTTSDFSTYITSTATVEAAKEAMVSPEMNGRILSIPVKQGQKVRKGELLVSLDSEIMRNGLEELEKSLELAKTLYEKQEELWKQGVGSEMQYLEAKNRYESMLKTKRTLESQLKMANIHAPFSGYIEKIFQKEGELASPGRQILQLISLDNLFINTEISEKYISSIQKGDTAVIVFPDLSGLTRSAPIENTSKSIDPVSRTFSLRLNMKNQNEQIKPNMLATLKLRDYSVEDVILIPTLYIRQDINGYFLYLARPHDGEYFSVKTYIKPGRSDGHDTVVEEGLKASDMLVVKGFNQIKDGSKLNITQ